MIFSSERLITELTVEALLPMHALDVRVQAPRSGEGVAAFATDVASVLHKERKARFIIQVGLLCSYAVLSSSDVNLELFVLLHHVVPTCVTYEFLIALCSESVLALSRVVVEGNALLPIPAGAGAGNGSDLEQMETFCSVDA